MSKFFTDCQDNDLLPVIIHSIEHTKTIVYPKTYFPFGSENNRTFEWFSIVGLNIWFKFKLSFY